MRPRAVSRSHGARGQQIPWWVSLQCDLQACLHPQALFSIVPMLLLALELCDHCSPLQGANRCCPARQASRAALPSIRVPISTGRFRIE